MQKPFMNKTVVLLLMSIGVNFWVTLANGARVEMLQALDQYRIGSKNLSFAAQSYAVTGKQHYLDNYIEETEEKKNKEQALAILKDSDVKEAEWEELNRIIAEEEAMVPLEEEAIGLAKAGNIAAATEILFGTTYEELFEAVSNDTEELISVIQRRKAIQIDILGKVQILAQVILVISILNIVMQFMRMYIFSTKKLLKPVIQVAEQMKHG